MYTVISLYDVFYNDINSRQRKSFFSTVPADYLSNNGFYI